MIDIIRHLFCLRHKINNAVARITPFFFHVLNHHAAWWRLVFELFYGFIDLVFLSLTFLLLILDELEKSSVLQKRTRIVYSFPTVCASWQLFGKPLFSTGLCVCRWIDTQWLVWCVYMLAINKTREQLDALMRKHRSSRTRRFHGPSALFSLFSPNIVLLST